MSGEFTLHARTRTTSPPLLTAAAVFTKASQHPFMLFYSRGNRSTASTLPVESDRNTKSGACIGRYYKEVDRNIHIT